MLKKLFKMVENAHDGMSIVIEYYHVLDYVISIYKSPLSLKEDKPLIRTHGSMDYAVAEAYILLDRYLDNTEEEQNDTVSMSIKVKENLC